MMSFIIYLSLLFIKTSIAKVAYDSYFNLYKEIPFISHKYQDISNSTWKEYFISENISNFVKLTPFYIDSDSELDLFVQDSHSKLYWVSNIRGTSKELKKEFVSKSSLTDFVVSNLMYRSDSYFILAINDDQNRILKFTKTNGELINTNISNIYQWKEEVFLDITDNRLSVSKDSKIKTLHLYEQSKNKQFLLVSIENSENHKSNLIKVTIENKEIVTMSSMAFDTGIKIIGSYDMDNDGLIDILVIDEFRNLYVLLNDDPFYYKVLISHINPTLIKNVPRIFVIDSNRDDYPDILTADLTQNTIGLLFNRGKHYWSKVKKYFRYNSKAIVYKKDIWHFIPLIDVDEENISEPLIDFTMILINNYQRVNFEIFAIFNNQMHWLIEKEVNIPDIDWNRNQLDINYMYCMRKSDIVIEHQIDQNETKYEMIVDIDVNNDTYPEFILYSSYHSSLYWIKKYEPYFTSFGWEPSFWIYLMILIYIISSLIGLFEFYRLKKLNDEFALSKLLSIEEDKKKNEMELQD